MPWLRHDAGPANHHPESYVFLGALSDDEGGSEKRKSQIAFMEKTHETRLRRRKRRTHKREEVALKRDDDEDFTEYIAMNQDVSAKIQRARDKEYWIKENLRRAQSHEFE